MRPPVSRPRPISLAAALAVALPGFSVFSAQAQESAGQPLTLKSVKQLHQTKRKDARPALALSADRISSEMDQTSTAEGDVQLRYGGMLLKSNTLRYDYPQDLATAEGEVELSQNGAVLRRHNYRNLPYAYRTFLVGIVGTAAAFVGQALLR